MCFCCYCWTISSINESVNSRNHPLKKKCVDVLITSVFYYLYDNGVQFYLNILFVKQTNKKIHWIANVNTSIHTFLPLSTHWCQWISHFRLNSDSGYDFFDTNTKPRSTFILVLMFCIVPETNIFMVNKPQVN